MQLQLQGAYLHFFPDLRSYVERRLDYALGRCKAMVRQATVSLKNRKPSRRDAEWCCAIRVKLTAQPVVSVDATRALPSEAIDGAIGQLGEKVARTAARKARSVPRGRVEPIQVQPQWGGRSLEIVPKRSRSR